jgi:hypothetical protein
VLTDHSGNASRHAERTPEKRHLTRRDINRTDRKQFDDYKE